MILLVSSTCPWDFVSGFKKKYKINGGKVLLYKSNFCLGYQPSILILGYIVSILLIFPWEYIVSILPVLPWKCIAS